MARKGKKDDFIDDSDASLGEEEASEEAAFSAEDGNDSEDVKPKSKKSSSKAAPKAKTVRDKKVKEKDVKPASKKRKASDDDEQERGGSKSSSSLTKNEDGDYYADLDKYKRVTVRQFQGKTLIDIREFYTDRNTEEKKPGKKGIALNMEVWKALKKVMNAVDEEANRLEGKD